MVLGMSVLVGHASPVRLQHHDLALVGHPCGALYNQTSQSYSVVGEVVVAVDVNAVVVCVDSVNVMDAVAVVQPRCMFWQHHLIFISDHVSCHCQCPVLQSNRGSVVVRVIAHCLCSFAQHQTIFSLLQASPTEQLYIGSRSTFWKLVVLS